MNKTRASLSAMSAVGSLLAMSAVTAPTWAADQAAANSMEKCYGVVKAGKNDCAGNAHACQGQSKVDAGSKEFITVPKGTCERLSGGSLTAK